MKKACLLVQATYQPGDLPPEGYLAWHEWAEVQRKAGIHQVACGRCGLWRTPQELSGVVDRGSARTSRGAPVDWTSPVCTKCLERERPIVTPPTQAAPDPCRTAMSRPGADPAARPPGRRPRGGRVP